MKEQPWLHLNSNRWNSAITEYAVTIVKVLSDYSSEPFHMVYGLSDKPFLNRIQRGVHLQEKLFLRGTRFGLTAWFSLLFITKPKVIIASQGRETLVIQSLKLLGFFRGVPFARFYGSAGQRPASKMTNLVYKAFPFLKPFGLFPTRTMQDRLGGGGALVPLAIDSSRFYLDKRSYQTSEKSILLFGRFDPIKGHREFLDLFKKFSILDKNKTKLKFVGKRANVSKHMLDGWVEEQGLQELVEVIDEQVQDVAELFSKATLGVVASLGSEVICRVTQEMLCCGTPVVVSGVGSLSEYVDGKNVFRLRDEASLFDAMELVKTESVDDRHTRSKSFQAKYSMASMAEALIEKLT